MKDFIMVLSLCITVAGLTYVAIHSREVVRRDAESTEP